MVSLQEVAFCYILMMLAVPVTSNLLAAFKRKKKPAEVKPQDRIHKYKYETLTLQQAFGAGELGTGAVGYTTNLSKTLMEEDYRSFLSFQALDMIKQIKYIEENPANINWEEWEEWESDTPEEKESDTEEKKELDAKVSGISTTPSTADDEFLYRLQEELELTSHVLLSKPMRSRKKGYGKSMRVNGRTLKAEWTR